MSRTKRGGKCLSHEYWSARPLNRGGGMVGKFTKKLTARIERRNDKKLIEVEIDDSGRE